MQTVTLQSRDSNEPVEVSIVRPTGSSRAHNEAKIGDRVIEFDLLNEDVTHGSFIMHGRTVRYFATRHEKTIHVWVNGLVHVFQLVDRVARRATGANSSAAASNRIIAPMPGTILKINVEPGTTFAAREPIIIMESMKMEMTLTSPAAGRIEQVSCKVGQLVDQGELLATLKLDDAST